MKGKAYYTITNNGIKYHIYFKVFCKRRHFQLQYIVTFSLLHNIQNNSAYNRENDSRRSCDTNEKKLLQMLDY